MNTSHRFASGVHILALLALSDGPLSSAWIAGSVNTNPAMIRRILGMLSRAGLTHSSLGSQGGTTLARAPNEISLLEIHRAVEEPTVLALHANAPNPACDVGRCITGVLENVIERAEGAMEAELAAVSVQDIVHDLKLNM